MMKCYICAKEGKESDAVAVCVACGMGTCMKHTIRKEIDVWEGGYRSPPVNCQRRCRGCSARTAMRRMERVSNGVALLPLPRRGGRDVPPGLFRYGAAVITLLLAAGTKPAAAFNVGIGELGGLGDWLAIGLVFGITIAAVISSLGRVSGAHVNPAVTIALWATKRFPSLDAAGYIVSQCIGAAAGSLLLYLSLGASAVTIGGLGATSPFPGIGYRTGDPQ